VAKIKMLKTLPIALDGIHANLFKKGEIYPNEKQALSDKDIVLLVNKLKVAEIIPERKLVEPSEKPMVEPSETKSEETKSEKDDEPKSEETKSEKEDELKEDKSEEGITVANLAKKYNTPNRAILNAAQKLKINATAPSSKLTAKAVLEIKEYLEIK